MKVCFVGSGSIGRRHMKNLHDLCQDSGEELNLHVLRSGARGALPSELTGIVRREAFSSCELDPDYDAVFICNPTFRHYDTICGLKNHSRCFFVEKPVFDRTDYRLEDMELPSGNQYYVACPLRYSRVLMRAKEILRNRRVVSAQAVSSSYLPDWREGVDYRQTYSAKKEEGGGVRIDLIHEWDYLADLFGQPEEVFSLSGKYSDLEITSEDLAVYIARYSDKLLELHLDYFGRQPKRYLRVWTSEEEYLFDILNGSIYTDGVMTESFHEERNEMYLREMAYFMELIDGKVKDSNTLEHAYQTMKIAILK